MDGDWLTLLARGASELGLDLDEGQKHLFSLYYREIATWNQRMNLFSRRAPEETLLKNFIDSLAAAPYVSSGQNSVLDLGSGGGFPGVPLKIALSALKVSLLEASRKKVSFLKHLIRTLELEKMTVIHGRADDFQARQSFRHVFDVVISRAAFKLPQFLSWGAFYLAPSGVLIAMKGAEIREEIEEAKPSAAAGGLYLEAVHNFTLPVTGDGRTILIYKTAGTA